MFRRGWKRLECANQRNENQLSKTKLAMDHFDLHQSRVYCTTLPTVRSTISTVALE